MALTDKLKAIADAIHAKVGGTDTMTLDDMPTAISNIKRNYRRNGRSCRGIKIDFV